jgi:hypothetical protein
MDAKLLSCRPQLPANLVESLAEAIVLGRKIPDHARQRQQLVQPPRRIANYPKDAMHGWLHARGPFVHATIG